MKHIKISLTIYLLIDENYRKFYFTYVLPKMTVYLNNRYE